MSRTNRLMIFGALALVLALGLARVDFSAGSGSSQPGSQAAASEFVPSDVNEEHLLSVAPAPDTVAFFQARTEANPNSYIDFTHLASQHLRVARDLGLVSHVDMAIEAAGQALAINPNYPVAIVTYANALATNHRFEEAIEWASKVPESSRSRPNALAVIGDSRLALGDYEAAGQMYGELALSSPGAAASSRKAHLAFLNGDTDSAIDRAQLSAEQALAFGVDPHDMAWHLSAIGEFLLTRGEAETALGYFERGLELAPDHIFALAGTAHSRWMSGDLEGSAEVYERALAQVPNDTGIMTELADVYRAMGRDEETELLVGRAIEELKASMDRPELARRDLASVLIAEELELDFALGLAEAEVAERRDVYALQLLADARHAVGDHEGARVAIEQALQLGTEDAALHFSAGVIYAALGIHEAAADSMAQVQEINPNFSLRDSGKAKELLAEVTE